MELPSIPVRLTDCNLDADLKRVMSVVRPQWTSDNNWSNLTSKIFTDGLTNKLIGYFLPESPRDVIIVKIYGTGTEDMIDRGAEIETMKFLNERGMGSRIYCTFENGVVYQFVPGKTLDTESCRDPKIFPLVAAEMAKLHSIPLDQLPSIDRSAFWNKFNTFLKLASEVLDTNPNLSRRYAEFGLTAQGMAQRLNALKRRIEAAGMPYAFCHNDILLANIIFDDATSSVSFIDHEYALLNYGPFDVANHFNEFGGVENADFSLCPDKAFMAAWIKEYLKHWVVTDKTVDVETFQRWVDLCIPLSHLFWSVWTVIQAQNSAIDFDYVKYGEQRFTECEKRMKLLETSYSSSSLSNGVRNASH